MSKWYRMLAFVLVWLPPSGGSNDAAPRFESGDVAAPTVFDSLRRTYLGSASVKRMDSVAVAESAPSGDLRLGVAAAATAAAAKIPEPATGLAQATQAVALAAAVLAEYPHDVRAASVLARALLVQSTILSRHDEAGAAEAAAKRALDLARELRARGQQGPEHLRLLVEALELTIGYESHDSDLLLEFAGAVSDLAKAHPGATDLPHLLLEASFSRALAGVDPRAEIDTTLSLLRERLMDLPSEDLVLVPRVVSYLAQPGVTEGGLDTNSAIGALDRIDDLASAQGSDRPAQALRQGLAWARTTLARDLGDESPEESLRQADLGLRQIEHLAQSMPGHESLVLLDAQGVAQIAAATALKALGRNGEAIARLDRFSKNVPDDFPFTPREVNEFVSCQVLLIELLSDAGRLVEAASACRRTRELGRQHAADLDAYPLLALKRLRWNPACNPSCGGCQGSCRVNRSHATSRRSPSCSVRAFGLSWTSSTGFHARV